MYLLQGKLTAVKGHAEELAAILIEASKVVAASPGCRLYVIARDDQAPDHVYVTEIWNSKEDHDDSLKNEDVRNLILKAVPLLEGQPEKGQELDVLGGFGI